MNAFGLTLVLLAFAVIQMLIGGVRLMYSLPAYGLIALVSLCALSPRWRRSEALPLGCLSAALLLAGYIFFRGQFSPVDYLARADRFCILGALMVYGLAAAFFVNPGQRLVLIWGLLGLAAAQVVVGAIQFREAQNFMPFSWLPRSAMGWRASGFYVSPNHLAGLLEVLALLCLSLTIWSKRSILQKALLAYAGICCLLGVAITGSRGGYVSLTAGALCFLGLSLIACRKLYPKVWPLILLGAIFTAVVIAGVAGTLLFESEVLKLRFSQIQDLENMRLLLWAAAWEQFHLNPVWGTGSGTYLYFGRMFRDVMVQKDPVFVHNDYLQLLAEYGVVGASVCGVFLLTHLVAGLRSLNGLLRKTGQFGETKSDALALHIGAFSAIGAYAAHSALDFNLHIPSNALLMALMFGIVANPGVAVAKTWRTRAAAGLARASLGLAALAILVLGVPLLRGEWYFERSRQALSARDPETARGLASEGLRFEHANPDLFYVAGEAALALAAGKTEGREELWHEAVAMFEGGLAVFPDDSRNLVKLAQAHDQLGQFDEAEDALDRAAAVDPKSAYVPLYYGDHFMAQQMILEAATQYQLAADLDYGAGNMVLRERLASMEALMPGFRGGPHNPPPELEIDAEGNLSIVPASKPAP